SLDGNTSFLNGADHRLAAPLLNGFNDASVTVYWVALAVVLLAFVLAWFLRAPALRAKSAVQEAADDRAAAARADELALEATQAGNLAGALIEPVTGSLELATEEPPEKR
ncbi:MAG TPA: hypothetical protein VN759_11680, partial [Pseudolysinimonas sp.]|nr:hypothetical protein [Pseudolysinimonas sp.]